MRGGTSRGPYFNRADLPDDPDALADVLTSVIGTGHPLNIDGIGGGASVTNKVAMISPSSEPGSDIDYFFAQVDVLEKTIDVGPTCGNILSGVGPAAIEMGMIAPRDPETPVRIRAVNVNEHVNAIVQTPGGVVEYQGETVIDGVPGSAAPVHLVFFDIVGAFSGALFPTGRRIDQIGGRPITCLDLGVDVVIGRALDFGLRGNESVAALNNETALLEEIEELRRQAGVLMGLGDVSGSVVPKFALVHPAEQGGTLAAHYFTPKKCHPSMAVTGAICIAAAAIIPGTVAAKDHTEAQSPRRVVIEHPMGHIDVEIAFSGQGDAMRIESAALVRTARLLAKGSVFSSRVPEAKSGSRPRSRRLRRSKGLYQGGYRRFHLDAVVRDHLCGDTQKMVDGEHLGAAVATPGGEGLDPWQPFAQRLDGNALHKVQPLAVDIERDPHFRRHQAHDPIAMLGLLDDPGLKAAAPADVHDDPVIDAPGLIAAHDEVVAGKLGDRDGVLGGEPVARRQHTDQAFLAHDDLLEVAVIGRAGVKSHVQPAVQHPVQHLRRGRVDQSHLDLGIGSPEAAHRFRQQATDGEVVEADTHLAGHSALHPPGQFHCFDQAVQDRVRAGEKGAAGLGQACHPGGPLEESNAALLLQVLDGAAERRLGDAQSFGGTAKAQFLGNRAEGSQVTQLDPH